MMLLPRRFAATFLVVSTLLVSIATLAAQTSSGYPFFVEVVEPAARQARMLELETNLGIAGSAAKQNTANEIAQGYLYKKPATSSWEQALAAAEYLELSGHVWGLHFVAQLLVAEGAPYPDFAANRRLLERCLSSADNWVRYNSLGLLGDIYRYSYGAPTDYARAGELYRQGAEAGNSASAQAYAGMLANGYLGAPRLDEALLWYRKSKELGFAANWLDGTIAALEAGTFVPDIPIPPRTPPEFDIAERHRQAEAGDAVAAAELATIYGRGMGGVYYNVRVSNYWAARAENGGIAFDREGLKNGSEAFWKSMAERGSPLGKSYFVYHVGHEGEAERAEYLRLCDEVIAAGYPRGHYQKAFAFLKNETSAEAVNLFEQAAAMGYFLADAELALLYYNGTHVDRDYSKAVRHAERSRLRHTSVNLLGLCYLSGYEVEKDEKRAVELFQESMSLGGDSYPLYNLARCYANGWGVSRDTARAKELALEAQEAGSTAAAALIADIDAGLYAPAVPPQIGQVFIAAPQYGSQLPHYADFAIEGVAAAYRFFERGGEALLHARVKQGAHLFDAMLASNGPAQSAPEWRVVSVLPSLALEPMVRSGDTFLALEADGTIASSNVLHSRDGVSWTTIATPVPFRKLLPMEKGFLAVSHQEALYVSADGIQWTLAVDELKLGSYFAPFSIGGVSASEGWIIVTPDFGYATHSISDAPVLVSRDAKNWFEAARVNRTDGLSDAEATILSSADFSALSIFARSTGVGRQFVFRGAATPAQPSATRGGAFFQMFDIEGHVFAIGYAGQAGGGPYLFHTGLSAARPRSPAEAVAPALVELDRLYSGEPLPYAPLMGAVVGRALLAPTAARVGHYFCIPEFQSKPALEGDFKRQASTWLKPASDRPPVLFADIGADAKARLQGLIEKADGGDAAAATEIGKALLYGTAEVLKSEYLAMLYLQAASAKGDANASAALGMYWSHKDTRKAEDYFKAAMAAGSEEAAFEYAKEIVSGRLEPTAHQRRPRARAVLEPLVAQNNQKAIDWTKYLAIEERLAEGYDAESYRKIIALWAAGAKMPTWAGVIDSGKARLALAEGGDATALRELFEKARQSGDEASMKNWLAKLVAIGDGFGIYYDGLATFQGSLGRTQDAAAGVVKIQQAADLGSVLAIKEVVAFHARGLHGYARDLEAARSWALKVKEAGETEWADAYLKTLDAEAEGAAHRRPLDGRVSNLDAKVLEQMRSIQNAADVTAFAKDRVGYLFAAIWWDAVFSADEEDLIQETLSGATVEISAADGASLTFTKPPPAGDHDTWRAVFPSPFPLSDANYPLTSWSYAATPGPTAFFLRNPATRDQARAALAQAIFQELSKRVKTAEQTYNAGVVTEFATMLLSRARGGDDASGREFAATMYSIIKDDIKANPTLLGYFDSLRAHATAPVAP